ncbi:MAG TPA: FAD:protein FMN transferase [Arthrobacter sp.]
MDLSGVVKGWAIAQAAEVLTSAGLDNWCINASRDVLASGTNRTGPWTVGIVDPAERGDHIWTQTTTGSGPFLQVTVLAADIPETYPEPKWVAYRGPHRYRGA